MQYEKYEALNKIVLRCHKETLKIICLLSKFIGTAEFKFLLWQNIRWRWRCINSRFTINCNKYCFHLVKFIDSEGWHNDSFMIFVYSVLHLLFKASDITRNSFSWLFLIHIPVEGEFLLSVTFFLPMRCYMMDTSYSYWRWVSCSRNSSWKK